MSGIISLIVVLLIIWGGVTVVRKVQQGGFTQADRNKLIQRVILAVVLLVILAVIGNSIVSIPVGHRLVVYNRISGGFEQVRQPGYAFVLPVITEREMYDVRTMEYTMSGKTEEGRIIGSDSIQVLSKDGLKMDLDITVLFHPDPDKLNELHDGVGPEYISKIVRPTLRESIRNEFAKYEATEAYSTSRDEIQLELEERLRTDLGQYNVILEDRGVKLRNIVLPPTVVDAIEEKKAAQQEAERMTYVLDKERQEKERVQIEAEAQAERIRIVNEALASNPNYLNWLAIDKLNDNIELVISDGKTILNLDAIKAGSGN
jgi:regulator of protease activity HflC (stomatin/prohibitin superfamily)